MMYRAAGGAQCSRPARVGRCFQRQNAWLRSIAPQAPKFNIEAHKRCMRGWCRQKGAGKATEMDEQQAAAFAKLIELTDKIEPGEINDMIDLLAIEEEIE